MAIFTEVLRRQYFKRTTEAGCPREKSESFALKKIFYWSKSMSKINFRVANLCYAEIKHSDWLLQVALLVF